MGLKFVGGHDGDQGRVVGTEGLVAHEKFLKAVECPQLFELFRDLFGCDASSFDYKWLRAVHPGGQSGFHVDAVYMARGSPKLLPCWIPLIDVPLELGGLAVMPGTHTSTVYKHLRDTYGNL